MIDPCNRDGLGFAVLFTAGLLAFAAVVWSKLRGS